MRSVIRSLETFFNRTLFVEVQHPTRDRSSDDAMRHLQARLNDTDFTFLTFEELIRERAVPDGTQLQILSLRSFKQALDDAWTDVAHTVLLAAENTISLRLRPADICTRESDDTFLFEFASKQPKEARTKVEEITTALMTCLIGDRFAGVRVQLAEIDVQEILTGSGELDPEKLDAVIRHADTFVLESGTIRPLTEDPANLPKDADGWQRVVHWWDVLERQMRQAKASDGPPAREPPGWQTIPGQPPALPGWQDVPAGEMSGAGRLSGGGDDRDARVGPSRPVHPRSAPNWAEIATARTNSELDLVEMPAAATQRPDWAERSPDGRSPEDDDAAAQHAAARRPDWQRMDPSRSPKPDWRQMASAPRTDQMAVLGGHRGGALDEPETLTGRKCAEELVWERAGQRLRKPVPAVPASETRTETSLEVVRHSDTIADQPGRLAGGDWRGTAAGASFAAWQADPVADDQPTDWQAMPGRRSRIAVGSHQPVAKEVKQTPIEGHTLVSWSDWVPLHWPPPSQLRAKSIPDLDMEPLPSGQVIGYLPTIDLPRRRLDTYVTVPLEQSPDGHARLTAKGGSTDPDAAARLDFALLYTALDQTEKNIENRRGLQMIVPVHGSTLCPPYLDTVSAILRSFPDASRARYLTLEVASWPETLPDQTLDRVVRDVGRRVRQMVLRVDRHGPNATALTKLEPVALGVDIARGDPELLAFFLSRFERLRSFLWGVHRWDDRRLLCQGRHWLANGDALWAPVHEPEPPQDAAL